MFLQSLNILHFNWPPRCKLQIHWEHTKAEFISNPWSFWWFRFLPHVVSKQWTLQKDLEVPPTSQRSLSWWQQQERRRAWISLSLFVLPHSRLLGNKPMMLRSHNRKKCLKNAQECLNPKYVPGLFISLSAPTFWICSELPESRFFFILCIPNCFNLLFWLKVLLENKINPNNAL